MNQDELPYYPASRWIRETLGKKMYKLSLDAGMTCPNRDGTLGTRGCIFCSGGGSGEFAVKAFGCGTTARQIEDQIEKAKARVAGKIPRSGPYIAYFQSFTNTYGPVDLLEEYFAETLLHPEIAALSVATRPDCLEREKIELLRRLNQKKPVWVELGLQTIHPETARFIRRGYDLPVFEEAVRALKDAGITVIVHVILGLPGETKEDMLQTVDYLAHFSPEIDGIKLQLLHLLKGTDLAEYYREHPFPLFSMDEYIDFVITCLEHLPPSMAVHRITGDGPKSLLIAPLWSADKKRVLNTFTRRIKERGTWQGRLFEKNIQSAVPVFCEEKQLQIAGK